MTVCYFGQYNKNHPRNANIILGLQKNNVKVIEIHSRASKFKKHWLLFKEHWRIRNQYDLMIVGFPGQSIMLLAKIISKKKIIFDLHTSFYDTVILENKRHSKWSFSAFFLYFLDYIACHLADKVMMDTREHADYIASLLHLKREKVIVIYHGVNEEIFHYIPKVSSNSQVNDNFIVEFHGYIQPLNGMDLVIHAMSKLRQENIELWVIGAGSEYSGIQELTKKLNLKNIKFYPIMNFSELVPKISQADIGLGFFKQSSKGNRVVANKIYELMSLKIPVVTGESKSCQSLFKHKEDIYYCKTNNVDSIANAFLELKHDKELRKKIFMNAYSKIQDNFTIKIIGIKLIKELKIN